MCTLKFILVSFFPEKKIATAPISGPIYCLEISGVILSKMYEKFKILKTSLGRRLKWLFIYLILDSQNVSSS